MLSGPGGTWNTQFGGPDGAGKSVVVGVIDSGYTPSSAFFAGEEVQPSKGERQVGIPCSSGNGIAMLKSDGSIFEAPGAAVRSTMMTTAGDVKRADGTKNTDLHATGAGRPIPPGC